MFDGFKVKLLNETAVIDSSDCWNSNLSSKLWLYNLHYFDDFVASDSAKRLALHTNVLNRWIVENPAPIGVGWEPYTVSLRIVNCIKAFLGNMYPTEKMLGSVAEQAQYLARDTEKHLLGNHYFANGKALIFAGIYFSGSSPRRWLRQGLRIIEEQIDEQILPDGGNFELSPMYHAIMLVDLLDMINILNTEPQLRNSEIHRKLKRKVHSMRNWLAWMNHPDGEISFFNDAAIGVAPNPGKIDEYALALGLDPIGDLPHDDEQNLCHLESSGYVVYKSDEITLIADIANVGPDYIPAHAHADTLSFELSLLGQRIFVNSGVSEYGVSCERLRQRRTAAHNTVVVNDLDSSQVWSGFRVAKRARICDQRTFHGKQNVKILGAHNGFKTQGVNCIHERVWHIHPSRIIITDTLKGQFKSALSYLHLHPSVEIVEIGSDFVELHSTRLVVRVVFTHANLTTLPGTWHPEFGVVIPNTVLVFELLRPQLELSIEWDSK
ncbi:MAG: heparinase II/III family protein [Pseudomonadales bacterium]|nr:heparinase II/III family protein [Pseudomonadales bacterium]